MIFQEEHVSDIA